MKYKLLSVEKNNGWTNIGDYIQALAASQFLPSVDGYVNREELSQYDGEESVVIMNGWFMHFPNNWPPSKKIGPIFLSFHINKKASDKMLTNPGVTYLKENGPIGCRDLYTLNLLKQRGVESWFTGCLTLTLGNKYSSGEKKENVYFVDPCIPKPTKQDRVMRIVALLCHPFLVYKISKKLSSQGNHNSFRNRISRSSQFIRAYSKIFTKECLKNAKFIEHVSNRYDVWSNEEKLYEAEILIRLYSRAKFVVTSRLHCALPCLGLQTPVYFTQGGSCNEESDCRFVGITELFNKITVYSNSISCDFDYKGKLSETNIVANKKNWEPLAKDLSAKCTQLISNISKKND